MMIWHVPNDVEVSQWSDQASLKYYTNTGFLNDYGGTLQSLYSKYYPVRAGISSSGNFFVKFRCVYRYGKGNETAGDA